MTRMSPDEFRRRGREVVDWIANYMEEIRNYAVLPRVRPGELTVRLPASPPQCGESMETILSDFRELIVPAVTHWNHPRFHSYFAVSGSGPGILAEALAAALNTNGMHWRSSPASTELEEVTLDWLRQWLGLPDPLFGVILDTASVGTMHALMAARAHLDPEARTAGHRKRMVLYTSEHAHSSVEKGAMAVGIGQTNVRKIGVDEAYRMQPELLAEAIQQDRDQGLQPMCVAATVGTTSVTSIDPLPAIADITAREGLWLHVDAAYGGAAAIVPEFRHVLDGASRADSLIVSPQKWLFTPIDCSVLFTRRPEALRRALALVPEYLRTAEDTLATNYMDYTVPLGRRFRALKLWFVMRYYGRDGVVEILRRHIELARELARWVEADERFELVAPTPFSLVCFRYRGSDAQNSELLDRFHSTGAGFLSQNRLDGRLVIRFAIGHIETTAEDVRFVWEKLKEAAAGL